MYHLTSNIQEINLLYQIKIDIHKSERMRDAQQEADDWRNSEQKVRRY